MQCLLDKVTIRFVLQALRKTGESQRPTSDELNALRFFTRSVNTGTQLFISPASASVLSRVGRNPRYTPIIQFALDRVQTAYPSRYYKRWSRRLRDFNFTREDAAILALATFGTDSAHSQLGMEVVVTLDQPMITNWSVQQSAIESKLAAMRVDLLSPYRQAKLPRVVRPEVLLQ